MKRHILSGAIARARAWWGGGEVLQDGVIQDDGVVGFMMRSRCVGVRVARKAGRRVVLVPTDSIATAAAVVRS